MLRRVMDLRNVVHGGDTVVELREAADQFADVDILWPVVTGEAGRPQRPGQHVCEIVLLRAWCLGAKPSRMLPK